MPRSMHRTNWLSAFTVLCLTALPLTAAPPATTTAIGGTSATTYNGHLAWRLTDGRSEAVIVPALGRVMRYGLVGGPNFLWNSDRKEFPAGEWKNWGGDKTWPAPQDYWEAMSGRGWPPDAAWDSSPQQALPLSNGHLRMTSNVAPGYGARVVREFWFNSRGDFVVQQTVEKLRGEPVLLSVWSVTQIATPDAIFLPLNPQSAYKQNFHWITPPLNETPVAFNTPTLLQVRALGTSPYKIGVDTPVCALAAVRDGVALIGQARFEAGQYPDGALTHGFPIELWNNQSPMYNELEFLSPLHLLKIGSRYTHTLHWSLHQLATKDVASAELRGEVESLLREPLSTLPDTVTAQAVAVQSTPAPATTPPQPHPSATPSNDFTLALAPNPAQPLGIAAIVPTETVKSTGHAVAVAKFARSIIEHKHQWRVLHIYVFSDKAAAQTFKNYVNARVGRPLRTIDFRRLAAVWPKVPVRYEGRGARENVVYPAQRPGSWWR